MQVLKYIKKGQEASRENLFFADPFEAYLYYNSVLGEYSALFKGKSSPVLASYSLSEEKEYKAIIGEGQHCFYKDDEVYFIGFDCSKNGAEDKVYIIEGRDYVEDSVRATVAVGEKLAKDAFSEVSGKEWDRLRSQIDIPFYSEAGIKTLYEKNSAPTCEYAVWFEKPNEFYVLGDWDPTTDYRSEEIFSLKLLSI